MDIKVLFDDLVKGEKFGKKPGNIAIADKSLFKYNFIADKFSYDIFENCGDLYEINLIKNYHIGKNPLVVDDDLNLDDFVIVAGKFYSVL